MLTWHYDYKICNKIFATQNVRHKIDLHHQTDYLTVQQKNSPVDSIKLIHAVHLQ